MPLDGWLEYDAVPVARGPGWVDGQGSAIQVKNEGIALVEQGRVIAAAWDEVLGAAVVDGRAYVFLPRRPPARPWIVLRVGRDGDSTVAEQFVHDVRKRIAPTSYRHARVATLLPAFEAATREILARGTVLGAVEIPAGEGPRGRALAAQRRRSRWIVIAMGASLGVFAGGYGALDAKAPLGYVICSAVVCALIGTGFGAFAEWWATSRRVRSRALVLTPQGGVIGLFSGARSFRWSEVDRFEVASEGGRKAVRVVGPSWSEETLDASWLDASADLAVAAAEAYRQRAAAR